MKATIEDLIADLQAKEPLIPYQLHEGLKQLIQGFGGEYNFDLGNHRAAVFLQRYVDERKHDEKL